MPLPSRMHNVSAIDVDSNILKGNVELDFDSEDFDVEITNTSDLRRVAIEMGLLKDAFNRLEVANPFAQADYTFKYDLLPLLFDTVETGGATVTHLPDESSVRLRCGTASGDKAVLSSRRYHRYQPGKGGKVAMTCVPGAKKANVRMRWLFLDDENGLFFQLDETNFSVVQRSSTSGSPVDTVINQSSFNGDKLDGTGASGITIDFTKVNIFEVAFQWFGSGDITFKLVTGSSAPVVMHTISNANVLPAVYMTTANLPIRYEIENIGLAATSTDMKAICSTVVSSGGEPPPEIEFGQGNVASVTTTDATETHLISFQLKSTFNSITNRMLVLPKAFDFSADKGCTFRVYLNSTLSGTSWVDVHAESGMQYDLSATVSVTGMPILPAAISGGGGSRGGTVKSGLRELALTLSADATSSDIITITVIRDSTNVAAKAFMTWGETR